MSKTPRPQVYHGIEKIRTSGSLLASLLLGIAGVLSIVLAIVGGFLAIANARFVIDSFIAGIIGLVLIAVAQLVSPKYTIRDYCEGCGNTIASTTRECPHCQSEVIPPPLAWWQRTNVILGIILALVIGGLILSTLLIG